VPFQRARYQQLNFFIFSEKYSKDYSEKVEVDYEGYLDFDGTWSFIPQGVHTNPPDTIFDFTSNVDINLDNLPLTHSVSAYLINAYGVAGGVNQIGGADEYLDQPTKHIKEILPEGATYDFWFYNFYTSSSGYLAYDEETGSYYITHDWSKAYKFPLDKDIDFGTIDCKDIQGAVPVADFTADQTEGPCPLTVQFTDQSTGEITSWFWDFGDGETSTEQNPTHTYNSTGYFTVSLTVTGPGGSDTETKEDYIHVTESLLYTYAPILKFNQGERYFPTYIEDMTNNSDIWEYRPFWPDTNLTEEKEIDTPGELKEYLKDHPNSIVYFDLDDQYWKHWTPTEYVVYGREYHPTDPPYNDRIYLQYWFFYIYNDWWNDHEGDWEMITVELDKDGNPLRVGYSQHHGCEVEPWEVRMVKTWSELIEMRAIEENHPVVYIAEGSHASYPNPGRTWQTIHWDEHYGNGEELRPSDYQLSNMEEGEHWEWINIEQLRWGKCDWPLMQEEYPKEKWNPLGNDGPPSPVAQGDKWERPGAWMDGIDIKINNKDNLTVSPGTPVVVTISLDPGESNAEADWWVWAETPFGLYCFNISEGWFRISDISEIIPAYQGKLMSIIGFPILWEVLPTGTYTFHFAIDLNPDGNLGTNRYEDVAQLTVE